MATTAAPTYFPSYKGYVDGGVVANNPSLAALAQTQDSRAKITNRPALDQVAVLSIGTGISLYHISGENLDWGYAQWTRPLIDLMLEANMGIADYQCRQIIGDNYHRLAPVFPPQISIKLDEWKKADYLVEFANNLNLSETISWLEELKW